MKNLSDSLVRAASAAALILTAAACGGSPSSGSSVSASSSALAMSVASSSTSTGTLLCTPTTSQVEACNGAAVGDPCVLTSTDSGTVAGKCRATLDGNDVACAPIPPAPPAELVSACAGKAAGDACTAADPTGDDRDGTCVTAPGTSTLVCGRAFTPPAGAIDACALGTVGDACALPDPAPAASTAAGTPVGRSGVCTLGPVGTGPLACSPAQALLPHGAAACAGLADGHACTLGRGHDGVSGTCVTPAEGGATVCVVACGALNGPFHRHHDGPGIDPDPVCTTRPPDMDPLPISTAWPRPPMMDPLPVGTAWLRPPAPPRM